MKKLKQGPKNQSGASIIYSCLLIDQKGFKTIMLISVLIKLKLNFGNGEILILYLLHWKQYTVCDSF